MPNRIDLTGQRFGRLVVQSFSHKDKHRHIMWNCLCDCGNTVIANTHTLISGDSQSCGCLRKEVSAHHATTHGLRHTELYHVWALMIQRISNPNCIGYSNYGGRGITVCDEWRNDFRVFYDWAISHGYQKGLSIDRMDVNGNYCPGNCRWATRKEQANNTRKTVWIEYDGQLMTITEAAERYNIPRSLVAGRIQRGWTDQEAIELPPYAHRKKKN